MNTGMALTNMGGAPGSLVADVQDVFDLVNAELTLSETGGALTSTAAEQNLFIINNPIGCIRPVVVYVDLDLMVAGDTHVFRVYYRIADGGAWELQDYAGYTGIDGGLPNGRKVIAIELGPTRFGVRVSLQRTAGADHVFAWSAFCEM